MSERMATRSWRGGGAPRTGGAQANDNKARCDADDREPGISIRVSSRPASYLVRRRVAQVGYRAGRLSRRSAIAQVGYFAKSLATSRNDISAGGKSATGIPITAQLTMSLTPATARSCQVHRGCSAPLWGSAPRVVGVVGGEHGVATLCRANP